MKDYLTILCMTFCLLAAGQETFNKDIQVSDSLATQYGNLVVIDTFIYVIGITVSTDVPGQNRGLITKFDFDGNKIWEQTYGDSLNTSEPENLRRTLSATSDGNLVFTGFNRNGFGPFSTFLYKIDAETGEQIFYQQYFNVDPAIGLSGNWVIETTDSGFLIGIDIREAYGSTLIIKTDSYGIEEWRQTIFNSGEDVSDFTMMATNLSSGNVFFTTREAKINCENDVGWFVQAKFLVIDLNGNIIEELITDSLSKTSILAVTATEDGGVVVAGSKVYQMPNQNGSVPFRCAGNPYLAKYDASLNLIWENELITELGWFSQWWTVEEWVDEKILVAGERYFGDLSVGTDEIPKSGNISQFSSSGDSLWSREIRPVWDNNFYNVIMKFTGVETSLDNKIFISGQLHDITFASPTFGQHGWLVKLDSFGCLEPGCQIVSSIDSPSEENSPSINIFPTPAEDYVNLQFDSNTPQVIRIYNTVGQELLAKNLSGNEDQEIRLSVKDFPNGLYLMTFEFEEKLHSRKILVQH